MGEKQVETKKQTFFKRLYGVVFQFIIQKYYTWQKNTFWCNIVKKKKKKKHDAGELHWIKY